MDSIVNIFEGVFFQPKRIISHHKGDISHGLKVSDPMFSSFGEAYFTKINCGEIKGWKLHKKMQLNLFVISGEVRFFVSDVQQNEIKEIVINCDKNFGRLCVSPNFWLAFEGLGSNNIVANIASIEHDPEEAINKNFELGD